MNYQLVIVRYRDIIQDSSWDGPDKVKCPAITSVGWLVDPVDSVTMKIAGTLDDEGNPCASLAIPRGCCLSVSEISYETPTRQDPPSV